MSTGPIRSETEIRLELDDLILIYDTSVSDRRQGCLAKSRVEIAVSPSELLPPNDCQRAIDARFVGVRPSRQSPLEHALSKDQLLALLDAKDKNVAVPLLETTPAFGWSIRVLRRLGEPIRLYSRSGVTKTRMKPRPLNARMARPY